MGFLRKFTNAALCTTSAFLWVALAVRVAKAYAESQVTEHRRLEEASMLLELVCSSARGAALAREFARCEEAHVLLRGGTFSRLRVLDGALSSIFGDALAAAKQGGLALAQVACVAAVLAHAPAALFGAAVSRTLAPREPLEREIYSPIAQSRLHSGIKFD
jgi:hypothetical protein